MNKLKLLFLFSIVPYFAFALIQEENKWNKSPIENICYYLDSSFISETTFCKKGDLFSESYFYLDDEYCTVTTEYDSDYISAFSTTGALINASYSATSQPTGSYSDQTATIITQSAGLSFDISTNYEGGTNGVNIWIDFDKNGVFDDAEKLFSGVGSTTHSGTIVIPSTIEVGQYRMRVRAQWGSSANPPACGSVSYGSTIDFTLAVIDPPACIPPSGLGATSLSLTSVELSWTSDGDSFELEWGEAGFTLGDGTLVENLTATSTTVTTVIDTPYQFYVRRDCGADGYSLWAGPFNFKTGYCTPTYTNGCSNGAKISNFEINNAIIGLSNNTGTSSCGENGYNNFTTISASAPAEMQVSFVVGIGSYSAGAKIWVDWNGNGEFETNELMAESASTIQSGNNFTGTFVVPAGTALGNYRMRVRVVEGSTSFTACSSQSYGEVEDYTFTVINPPACMPPSGLGATALSLTSVELSWTSDGDSFELEWGEAGFTLGDGTLVENLTATSTTVTTVIDTPYQFYVRRDCGADGYSLWAGPFNFKTGYCTPTYTNGCSNGAKISNFEINNAIIGLSNNTGTSSCGENGYNNFTTISASAPAEMQVSFVVGIGSYSAGAKIWVDWNGNGEFETNELMAESASTIQSGNNFTGTFVVPAGTALGNYRMRVRVVEGSTSFTACSSQSYGEVEDYTFTVINPPACMPPYQVNVIQVTDDSIEVGWSAVNGQNSWEILVLPAGSPAPTQGATGFVTANQNPFTVNGLNPVTEYDVYVRANCGTEDGVSLWASPVRTTTTQVAAPVNFIDDFEGDTGWTFTNGNQINKWYIGTATAYAGATSLYVSDDEGVSNHYSNTTTFTHAIRDLSFPLSTNEVAISFYWKTVGEADNWGMYDLLKVWIMPSNYQPQAGVAITAVDGGMQIGGDFVNQEDWLLFQEVFNLSSFAGNTGRLIFEWRNNGWTANQTPAAIDNVNVSLITCSRPIEVQVQKHGVTGNLTASWTPVAGETQWEVIVLPAADPAPDNTAVGVIVNTPQYTIPNVIEGVMYKVYVRAICSENDKSLWTIGVDFSVFNPPACADLDLTPPDFNINEEGEYIICEGEDKIVKLEAGFDPSKFKSTDSYTVEQIDYAPPFPFVGGTEMDVSNDDVYSPNIQLPFAFCFYGNNFTQAQVSSNGAIHLGGNLTGGSAWSIGGDVQFPSPTYDNRMRNVIMGVFQDIDPDPGNTNNFPETYSMNYQVLGTYPCRALVVNFNDVPLFGCWDPSPEEVQTYQMVIYEITNIIEVYVKNRTSCASHNGGRGVIGLVNSDGTQATIPPGRNVGTWETQNEAWRFTPSGDTTVDFGWYMNGDLISTNPEYQVDLNGKNGSFDFEGRITYPGCEGGDDLVLRKGFTVKVSEEIKLGEPKDLIFCSDNLDDEDRTRITDNYDVIMQNIVDKNGFVVTYHKSQKDANEGKNAIANPNDYIPNDYPETIYVRVESPDTGCYATILFDVIEGAKPLPITVEDVLICNVYALPELREGQKYLYYDYINVGTEATEKVENPQVGVMLKPGDYEVYVLSTSKDGCYEEDSFHIKIFPCIIPKGISPNGDGENDYLDLADYMVQDIKIYNRYGKEVYKHGVGYMNQWNGQDNNGKSLPAGTYYYNIITPFEQFTGYIYLVREVK